MNRSNKLIPALRQSLNISGRLRRIPESGPDLRDTKVQPPVEIDKCAVAPHHLAGMVQQHGQDLCRLSLQANSPALPAQLA
jgi:hypothetical protein